MSPFKLIAVYICQTAINRRLLCHSLIISHLTYVFFLLLPTWYNLISFHFHMRCNIITSKKYSQKRNLWSHALKKIMWLCFNPSHPCPIATTFTFTPSIFFCIESFCKTFSSVNGANIATVTSLCVVLLAYSAA